MPSTPQAPKGTDYRYMGDHATEMPMGGALPWLAPGDFVTLSGDDATSEKAVRMIDEGKLVDITTIGAAGIEADAEAEAGAPEVNPESQAATEETKGGK